MNSDIDHNFTSSESIIFNDDIINKTKMTSFEVNSTTRNPLCDLNAECLTIDDYVDSLYDYIAPSPGKWALVVLYIITFLVGLTGNSLVCFAIWRNRSMRTVTNIFIVNLSIADLGLILLVLPMTCIVDVSLTWFFGEVYCKIYLFLSTLSASVSVLTLTVISLERWYAIRHPLRSHNTIGRARIFIVAIWIIALCLSVHELVFADVDPWVPYTVLLSSCYPAKMSYSTLVNVQITMMVVLYFLPLGLMGFAYINIAKVLWKGSIPGEPKGLKELIRRTNKNKADQMDARKRVAKMLFTIVVLFAICFLPNHVLNLLRYTRVLENDDNPETFALFAHWLACLNSCINPLIYNFMSDKFRREFRYTISKCIRCKYDQRTATFRRNDTFKVTFTSCQHSRNGTTRPSRSLANANGD